jgi:26S proteasome regulatory subunit N2
VNSNTRPSLFAYPSPTTPPKKEAAAKVATAVLSTTVKVRARERKKAAAEGETMDSVWCAFHFIGYLSSV